MARTGGLGIFGTKLFIKNGDPEISARLQQNVVCIYNCSLLRLYVMKIHEAGVCAEEQLL
jgi:hypothetical protein